MNDTHKHIAQPTLDELAMQYLGAPSADIDEAAELEAQAGSMLGQIAARITLQRDALTREKEKANALLKRLNKVRGEGKPDEVRQIIDEIESLNGAPSAPEPAAPSAPVTRSRGIPRWRTTKAQPEPVPVEAAEEASVVPVAEEPTGSTEPEVAPVSSDARRPTLRQQASTVLRNMSH